MSDCEISGTGECPECGEDIEFQIPAFLEEFLGQGQSGMWPEAEIQCPECKKTFIVNAKVEINLMGEE